MAQEILIEVKSLSKSYNGLLAVDSLDFNVFKGDIFGFLGPNGAGKSTTIRMILSLIRPDAGEINIFGLPLRQKRKTILSSIGALVEEPRFYEYLSAYSNLEMLGRLSGKNISRERIMDVLQLTGLHERWDSPVKSYSHGMKQRLGIAQAIVHDPELLILDEPANGLDPKGMKDMREIILRLNKEFGKTIFISSHILKDIELMANRMLIIDHGARVVEGFVHELLNTSVFDLKISVADPAKALDFLREHYQSAGLFIDHEGNIMMKTGRDDVPAVNQLLVSNGFRVFALTPVNTLEQYFLDNT